MLADFSHCDSNTLSKLSKAYCMNIYGSEMWKFNNKHLTKFYTAWRKAMRQIWRIPYTSHNNLIYLINNSYAISIIFIKVHLIVHIIYISKL